MEPLWSPVVATAGNQRQIDRTQEPRRQAKFVAVGCHRLPPTFHGEQGVCRRLPPVAGDPSLRGRGSSSRTLGRLVRRAGGPREPLLHHYAMSAIRARVYVLSTSGRRRGAQGGEGLARARSRKRRSTLRSGKTA